MSRFEKALQSLQPNIKDIVRTFLLDTNFGDKEYRRSMTITFTIPADAHLGYRRLLLTTRKDGVVPILCHDTDLIEFNAPNPPNPVSIVETLEGEAVYQTFEYVMNLIDSTTIKHIVSISVTKFHVENDIIFNWEENVDLAWEVARDETTHNIH